jgi:hypothetical protein
MIVRFDASSSGPGATAQYLGRVQNGFVKAWGFFPFWIGKSRTGLESPQSNPTGANLEVREGMYIKNDPTISGNTYPVVMPWNGEIYVLNSGVSPGESLSNIVIVDVEGQCG